MPSFLSDMGNAEAVESYVLHAPCRDDPVVTDFVRNMTIPRLLELGTWAGPVRPVLRTRINVLWMLLTECHFQSPVAGPRFYECVDRAHIRWHDLVTQKIELETLGLNPFVGGVVGTQHCQMPVSETTFYNFWRHAYALANNFLFWGIHPPRQ